MNIIVLNDFPSCTQILLFSLFKTEITLMKGFSLIINIISIS